MSNNILWLIKKGRKCEDDEDPPMRALNSNLYAAQLCLFRCIFHWEWSFLIYYNKHNVGRTIKTDQNLWRLLTSRSVSAPARTINEMHLSPFHSYILLYAIYTNCARRVHYVNS